MTTSQPCYFSTCPALAAKGHDYCTVHLPEAILERARTIVLNNFGPFLARSCPTDRVLLSKLRDDILHDLEETV